VEGLYPLKQRHHLSPDVRQLDVLYPLEERQRIWAEVALLQRVKHVQLMKIRAEVVHVVCGRGANVGSHAPREPTASSGTESSQASTSQSSTSQSSTSQSSTSQSSTSQSSTTDSLVERLKDSITDIEKYKEVMGKRLSAAKVKASGCREFPSEFFFSFSFLPVYSFSRLYSVYVVFVGILSFSLALTAFGVLTSGEHVPTKTFWPLYVLYISGLVISLLAGIIFHVAMSSGDNFTFSNLTVAVVTSFTGALLGTVALVASRGHSG
jgi:anti-sigma28 factor (negative regulator of flagellin synthesis)